MDSVLPKKIGVLFSPPSIILLYCENGTYKKRTMPIRDLTATSDCNQLANRLKTRHKKQLEIINTIKLESLIRLAQEVQKGSGKMQALDKIRREYEINPDEDLNKLTDKELKRRKEIMDLTFEKNSIGKDHPDFVYDKEVDFGGSKVSNEWDSGSEKSQSEQKPSKSEREPAEPARDIDISAGLKKLDLYNDSSDDSTPVNSPEFKIKTLVSAQRDLFGLDSPPLPSQEEPEPEPQPSEEKEEKSISGGENTDVNDEDDFW